MSGVVSNHVDSPAENPVRSANSSVSGGVFRVTEDRAVDEKAGFEIKRSVVRHIGSAVLMAVDEKKPKVLTDLGITTPITP